MSTDERLLEDFLSEMRAEFPRFRIVHKEHDALSKLIHRVLFLLTLGGQREYLTRYHTVLGDTLYVPTAWHGTPPRRRVITLRHERVHLRQRRRYTMLGMAWLYLVPFFPVGLAYGRARIEWEAYTETLAAIQELEGNESARSPELRRWIVAQFTGPAYGWMWPFPRAVERWYDEALTALGILV